MEKFIGDAVMAVFGAPVSHEDDPERAVSSALRITHAIVDLNEDPRTSTSRCAPREHRRSDRTLGARPARARHGRRRRRQHCSSATATCAGRRRRRRRDDVPRHARSVRLRAARPGRGERKAESCSCGTRRRRAADSASTSSRSSDTADRSRRRPRAAAIDYARMLRESSTQLVTIAGEPGVGKTRLLRSSGGGWTTSPSSCSGDKAAHFPTARDHLLGAGRDGEGAGRNPRVGPARRSADEVRSRCREVARDAPNRSGSGEPRAACRRRAAAAGDVARESFTAWQRFSRAWRQASARPGLRGPALGRRATACLRRASRRLVDRRSAARPLHRPAGVVRASARVGAGASGTRTRSRCRRSAPRNRATVVGAAEVRRRSRRRRRRLIEQAGGNPFTPRSSCACWGTRAS